MPTFYQKTPASGQNCLILEPGEGLLYPFEFDNWTEIKLSAFISLTTTDSDNKQGVDEYYDTNFLPKLTFWFGAKDGSNILPYTSGSIFAGFCSSVLGGGFEKSLQLISTTNIIHGNFNSMVGLNGSNILGSILASTRFYIYTNQGHLPTGFAGYNAVSLKRTNGYSGLLAFRGIAGNYTDVSVENLKKVNRSFSESFSVPSSAATGYFPPELNCFFIYNPFILNRTRIHSLLVEQLA